MINILKKILILGGTKQMISAVESAKSIGLSSIVVDNIVGAPAKHFADKAFNVNTGDVEKLLKIVQDENVDGIFTIFNDIDTWHAIALCKKTGLPLYTMDEHVPNPSNKEKFMEICSRFEVKVIEEYKVASEVKKAVSITWEFPVVIEQVEKNAQPRINAARHGYEKKEGHSNVLNFPKYEKDMPKNYFPALNNMQPAHITKTGNIR